MWLAPFFSNNLTQDIIATLLTLIIALLFLRLMDFFAHRGWIEPRLSRKIIHIGTGPIFLLCWSFFSPAEHARYLAAMVPLAISFQFAAVGLGWMKDEAAVQAMTRSGDPREILKGPLFYGIVFVLCTIIFWRSAPAGLVALMLLCGGDGLADIIGRRWGKRRLPFSPGKSWIGSSAMLIGGFGFAYGFVLIFNAFGYYAPALDPRSAGLKIGLIALVATLVEALPIKDIDNLTITFSAALLGIWLF